MFDAAHDNDDDDDDALEAESADVLVSDKCRHVTPVTEPTPRHTTHKTQVTDDQPHHLIRVSDSSSVCVVIDMTTECY